MAGAECAETLPVPEITEFVVTLPPEPAELHCDIEAALYTLCDFLGYEVSKERGAAQVTVTIPRATRVVFPPRSKASALAIVADCAMGTPINMTPREIVHVCGWDGIIPSKGLAGWEEGVFAQLKDVSGDEWRYTRRR